MRRSGLLVVNILTNGKKVPHRAIFSSPLAWVVGTGTIHPETNAPLWVQGDGFSQELVVRARKVIFLWLDSA